MALVKTGPDRTGPDQTGNQTEVNKNVNHLQSARVAFVRKWALFRIAR